MEALPSVLRRRKSGMNCSKRRMEKRREFGLKSPPELLIAALESRKIPRRRILKILSFYFFKRDTFKRIFYQNKTLRANETVKISSWNASFL